VVGFILFIVACLSFCITTPISILYGIWNAGVRFRKYAISIDQTINAISCPLLSKLLLKDNTLTEFGDMDKTISYNLGKNKHFKNLNLAGLLVCNCLHLIDKNHVEKAYEQNI